MTELLSKAFKKASELPDDSQNELAKKLIEEIEDELNWNKSFVNSKDKLTLMAEKAIKESEDIKTLKKGFDEL